MVHEARYRVLARVERDGRNKNDRIVYLARKEVGDNLRFSGLLVFHCPVKEDTGDCDAQSFCWVIT